jgi:hypothetical protein
MAATSSIGSETTSTIAARTMLVRPSSWVALATQVIIDSRPWQPSGTRRRRRRDLQPGEVWQNGFAVPGAGPPQPHIRDRAAICRPWPEAGASWIAPEHIQVRAVGPTCARCFLA